MHSCAPLLSLRQLCLFEREKFNLYISVIGLGHLGLPLASLLAAAGHSVIGSDCDTDHVAALARGEIGWHEPGLTALYHSVRSNLRLTIDSAEATAASEVSIIMVPTPSAADGSYDAKHVLDAITKIGRGLRRHDRPHVVVLASTVTPGTSEGPVAALLQETSGRILGPKLGLCYSPVFGALGNIIQDYSQPDFLLLGASDSIAREMATKLLGSIHLNQPPVLHRTLIDAELAKLALNSFVITKISFANMIGALCRSIPGADADQVLSVLGKDRRIGPHFLRAAMPYGGPCFARDVDAFVAIGARYGIAMPIANAATSTNHSLQDAIVVSLKSSTSVGGTIAIIGLAFRNNTDVTVGSPAIEIAEQLARDGYQIRAWDPLARPAIGYGVHVAGSMTECLSGADVALIANDNPRCAEIPPDIRRPDGQPLIVLDYWRMLDIAGQQGQLDIRR